MKTIEQLLQNGMRILKDNHIENALLDAQVLLSRLLNVDKLYLHIHSSDSVQTEIENVFLEQIEQRSRHMPIAYITNQKDFMALSFYVDEHVLIPRNDTEILVEKTISIIQSSQKENIEVLDLCCGSGCIGISLAYECSNAQITLSDISKEALEVAKINTETYDLSQRINLIQSDLFENIAQKKYDIITANPPYITSDELSILEKDILLYEPHLALSGGDDGLAFYKRILQKAPDFLTSNGYLIFEIGYLQAMQVTELIRKHGFNDVQIIRDYAQNDRVVLGHLN